ncbi:hypothetical protein CISIN_1g038348mg, partial [Citrus sinensis]
CDPKLRKPIWTLLVNQQNDVRRMYISIGLYQPKLEEFPPSFIGQQLCRFQYTWYAQFPWLEYSKEIDVSHEWTIITTDFTKFWFQTSIEAVKWLAKQACAFRGHGESIKSSNPRNFIEMIKYSVRMNKDIAELLNIIANKVRQKIREEIEDVKFCILVDEAQDESKKEQMAIILRYVDCDRFVHERFFEVLNVKEISASTLKKEICNVLTRYNLLVKDLRGQGYNDVSNMRGAWNELQTLFREDCPYAYYVHCFTHRLQLTLVKVSKDRHSELKSIREAKIIDLIASGELEIDIRANQICSLQRPRATLWSSHFTSISRLISMFGVVHEYFKKMICNGSNNDIREEAKGVYDAMSTFKFVFILHLMNKVLGINDLLCQTLQMKSQDILNTIHLISTTKLLLQSFRENDWDTFTKNVISFCESHHIDVPEMNDRHMKELNNKFIDQTMKLLTLSSTLNPIDSFKSFDIDDICNLAERFYHQDFIQFEINVLHLVEFQCISSLYELCRKLDQSRKSQIYFLLNRLIRLVLTLPVSTATTKRVFSAMKLIKTPLQNKMEKDFIRLYSYLR